MSESPDRQHNKSQAVVLLSGGLDSATVLAIATSHGHRCHALTFQYGQRHACELRAARSVAGQLAAACHLVVPIPVDLFSNSALTDPSIQVPQEPGPAAEIPVTYVPARNLAFLSLAVAYAESIRATAVYIGANAVDYSGYPDCRPEFIAAFEKAACLATRTGVEGTPIAIKAPIISMSKRDIIALGTELGVNYALTHSCYDPDPATDAACGCCDSCRIRRQAFLDAGVPDPTRYTGDVCEEPPGTTSR
ncbi:MAG: 7-cyano-7-deazaguanine synthase QueC [Planctomycetes bacterium]|nr:7-cyano-7-deazaguanine synthase QueC [Planctomycetota bacterium]NOG53611.1 7-cyano-7-deazaguanine synthase QueC [Planctomycetota bacterium]